MVQAALDGAVQGSVLACESEVGSGAVPTQSLPSAGIALRPGTAQLAERFRALPTPVLGRMLKGAFVLDVRCLEDEARVVAQLPAL